MSSLCRFFSHFSPSLGYSLFKSEELLMRMKLFLIVWGIFFTEMMAAETGLETALQEWWQQVTSFCNTFMIQEGSTHFSLMGKKASLHIQFAHVLWFDEVKEKYSPHEISNEGTNIQFSHPSYSRERYFQLLGKSRKNIWRGSEPKCCFSFP